MQNTHSFIIFERIKKIVLVCALLTLLPLHVRAGTLDEGTDTYLSPLEGDGTATNIGLSFGSVALQKLLYYDTVNSVGSR